MNIFYIMIGGAFGALLRFLFSEHLSPKIKISLLTGTLIVNLVGSFIIGFLWGLSEHLSFLKIHRHFIFIGFLGGFTTFSTFALDSSIFMLKKDYFNLFLYIFIHNFIGISLVFLGLWLANISTR